MTARPLTESMVDAVDEVLEILISDAGLTFEGHVPVGLLDAEELWNQIQPAMLEAGDPVDYDHLMALLGRQIINAMLTDRRRLRAV